LTIPLAQRRWKQEVETSLIAPIRYHLRAEPNRDPNAGLWNQEVGKTSLFMIAADLSRSSRVFFF
jgi:hypothetical protein